MSGLYSTMHLRLKKRDYSYDATWLAADYVSKFARPIAPHLEKLLFRTALKPTDIASSLITRPSYLASVTSGFPAVAMGVHISDHGKAPLRHFGKLACVVLVSIEAIQSFCLQCKCGSQTVHVTCVHRHHIATVFTHAFGSCAVASAYRSAWDNVCID